MPSESLPGVSLKLPASRIQWQAGGELLTLRPQELRDAPAVQAAVEASLAELRQWFPWAHAPVDMAQRLDRARSAHADYWGGKDMILTLESAAGAYLGCFGLHYRTLSPRGLEIGFWVDSRAAGRGLATAATRALVVYSFDWLGCIRVQCGADAANAASRRVQEKVGFQHEAIMRNFASPGTDEMRRAGFIGSSLSTLGALVPEDLTALPWVAEVRRTIQVFDWRGAAAHPLSGRPT